MIKVSKNPLVQQELDLVVRAPIQRLATLAWTAAMCWAGAAVHNRHILDTGTGCILKY